MTAEEIRGKKEFEERGGGLLTGPKKEEKPNWIPVSAQMHDHTMTLTRTPANVFYYQAEPMVNAFQAVAHYYNLDSLSVAGDVYNYEAEAMGQAMIYGDNCMPTIDFRDPLIKTPADLARVRVPNWNSDGRIPYIVDVMRLSKQRGITDQGIFCAPFSLAVGVRSYPLLVHDMKKDPKFAHELFTFLVDEILSSYLTHVHQETGLNILLGADAWSAYPNMTPELLEEFVVPYAERLRARLAPLGVFAMVVASGDYCEERLERFDKNILWRCLDIGMKCVGAPTAFLAMGRWQDYPLEPVAEYLAKYRAQGVNVHISAGVNARLLRDGPVSRIVDNIKRFADVLARHTVIDIFLANIPADTPSQHIHAAVAAAHTYGRLPIAENLDEIEFEVPQRESFEEFMALQAA
jgi:uroporphyrinogen-III decarboxylase